MYTTNRLRYKRFKTRTVRIGDLLLGGNQPIRVQSMTNTLTTDVAATVAQVETLVQAGCELVRITAPGIKDAQALKEIRATLHSRGVKVPLCADIHFSPRAALEAALHVEKVRINPGNFSGRPGRDTAEISEAQYDEGRDKAREAFRPLVQLLKREGKALRIGTNHGSLSQRMVQRWGDTPRGMVESALEYIRFCEEENFHNLVLSMKASNVRVMVYAYRELVERMRENEMNYPLHLGVTEAGGGIEGILKSAQGIGALLEDGIGDTVRVSLTDPPEMEVQPASRLAALFDKGRASAGLAYPEAGLDWTSWSPRQTREICDREKRFCIGGRSQVPVTLMSNAQHVPGISEMEDRLPEPDSRIPAEPSALADLEAPVTLFDSDRVDDRVSRRIVPVDVIHDDISSWVDLKEDMPELLQFHIRAREVPQINSIVQYISEHFSAERTLLSIEGENLVHRYRLLDQVLRRQGSQMPVDLLAQGGECADPLSLASQLGALLADGIGQSLTLLGDVALTGSRLFAFTVLQGAGARIFSTEFVSCPSCGRTLFDLEETSRAIRARTSHLTGLKIGIMGCIVNGPGEMADADFGYVGSAAGKVDLYVGHDVVRKNIPSAEAVDALIELIREHGKWEEPEEAQAPA